MTNSNQINEQSYPIEPLWILKSVIPSLVTVPFFSGYFYYYILAYNFVQTSNYSLLFYFAVYLISVPTHFLTLILARTTYKYEFTESYINLYQGLIRRQKRQLVYGVIQNIYVRQDLLDKLFGLASLTIENATNSVDAGFQPKTLAGFVGNSISIPGLSLGNANDLKEKLQKLILKNPIIEQGM